MQSMKMLLKNVVLLGAAIAVMVKTGPATADELPTSVVVTSILDDPFLSARETSDGKSQYEGYCADLLDELARNIGFNYTLNLVADGRYGQKLDDGTYNGMIGEVSRGDADLAVAPLTITSDREKVVEFTRPFMNLGVSIMIKRPYVMERPNGYLFIYPFSPLLWLVLSITWPAIGVVLFVLARYVTPKKQLQSGETPAGGAASDDANQISISSSLWFTWRTMFTRESNIEPRSLSGRVLIATWWLFVVFIAALYIANLVAFLVVYRNANLRLPIESPEDLVHQTEIKYGTIEGGSTKEFFRLSTDPIYEKMWKAMTSAVPSVFVKSSAEGVARVREGNGKYAFLMESTLNDYVNQRKPCDTMRVGPLLNNKAYGIALKVGSPLRARINFELLRLSESGFMTRLENKWWHDRGECVLPNQHLLYNRHSQDKGSSGLSAKVLTIGDASGLFYLLIFGTVLAVIIGLLEYVYARRKTSKPRKVAEAQPRADGTEKV